MILHNCTKGHKAQDSTNEGISDNSHESSDMPFFVPFSSIRTFGTIRTKETNRIITTIRTNASNTTFLTFLTFEYKIRFMAKTYASRWPNFLYGKNLCKSVMQGKTHMQGKSDMQDKMGYAG